MDTWNAGRWNSPEFDRLVELTHVEEDEKGRKQYYDAAVKLIVDEAPAAVSLHANDNKIFAKYVKNFLTIPATSIAMHRVWLDRA
jgi:ABC-type transport system substrate-binding protein